MRTDRGGREPLRVRHVGGETVEQSLKRRHGQWRLDPAAQIPEPLFRPVPKVTNRKPATGAVMAAQLSGGPAPRRCVHDRYVQGARPEEIETRRDHDQFARHCPERAARIPTAFQVPEKISACFCKRTLTLAGTRDPTGEQFIKHRRTPFSGIRQFSAGTYVVFPTAPDDRYCGIRGPSAHNRGGNIIELMWSTT